MQEEGRSIAKLSKVEVGTMRRKVEGELTDSLIMSKPSGETMKTLTALKMISLKSKRAVENFAATVLYAVAYEREEVGWFSTIPSNRPAIFEAYLKRTKRFTFSAGVKPGTGGRIASRRSRIVFWFSFL
jgi:hypothetical protein